MELQELLKTRPLVMGVINCTPDSFSDGGLHLERSAAKKRAETLLAQGAKLLDIGGMASGPGSKIVSEKEEIRRIEPVLRDLSELAPISVDTYRNAVAERALRLGARIINDISALRFGKEEICQTLCKHQAYVVLMYSKESGDQPNVSSSTPTYRNITDEISAFLEERVEYALSRGIKADKIILDPGMGRFLSDEACDSWTVLRELATIKRRFASFPLLVGTSRKSFLVAGNRGERCEERSEDQTGESLEERDRLSASSSLLAYENGADILRLHQAAPFFELLRDRS